VTSGKGLGLSGEIFRVFQGCLQKNNGNKKVNRAWSTDDADHADLHG
jgi:hypothetical protein